MPVESYCIRDNQTKGCQVEKARLCFRFLIGILYIVIKSICIILKSVLYYFLYGSVK